MDSVAGNCLPGLPVFVFVWRSYPDSIREPVAGGVLRASAHVGVSEQNPTLTYYDSYLFSLREEGLYIKDFSLPRKCGSVLEPHISYEHVISTTHLPI